MRLEETGDSFADPTIVAGRMVPEALLVVVAGATAVGECALAAALLRGTLAPTSAILVHLTVSAVIGASAAVALRRTASSALVHLALWTFTAGPFGAVLALGLIALDGSGRAKAADGAFGDWLDAEVEAHELGGVGRLRDDLLDGRLRAAPRNAVRPLRDALDGHDRAAKFEALARVGRAFDPALCPVIHAALRDADPSVRVLASTVLAKLQTAHGRAIASLQEAVAHGPRDPAAWVALARARLDLARSGLVKPLQARAELLGGLDAAERALAIAPGLAAAQALRRDLRLTLAAAAAPSSDAVP